MNVRERFKKEVCEKCDVYSKCSQYIGKQSQCATLATYFIIKKFTEERI